MRLSALFLIFFGAMTITFGVLGSLTGATVSALAAGGFFIIAYIESHPT